MSSPTLLVTEVTANGDRRAVSPSYPVPVYGAAPATPGSGGLSPYSNTALLATKAVVKASAGTVAGLAIGNPNAAIAYIQFFDALTGGVTVGTTVPTFVVQIPASSAVNLPLLPGVDFATGIVIAATTTATGLTALGAGCNVTLFYK